MQTLTASKAGTGTADLRSADRLADNIGLRVRFDTGVDMLGGVWRNCTYVSRVLRTHGSTCYEISAKFANEKPRDIARVLL